MKGKPRFFDGFSFARFSIKATALYLAFLGIGTTLADWSKRVSDLRDAIRSDEWAIGLGFAGWFSILGLYELLRLKLKYDLELARIENRRLISERKRSRQQKSTGR